MISGMPGVDTAGSDNLAEEIMDECLSRFAAGLGAIAVLGALAGCGGGKPVAASDRTGELTVWLTVDAQENWPDLVSEVNERFRKTYPKMKVAVQYQQWTTKNQKIDAALAGQHAPDVVEMGNSETTNYIVNGAFAPSIRPRSTIPGSGCRRSATPAAMTERPTACRITRVPGWVSTAPISSRKRA